MSEHRTAQFLLGIDVGPPPSKSRRRAAGQRYGYLVRVPAAREPARREAARAARLASRGRPAWRAGRASIRHGQRGRRAGRGHRRALRAGGGRAGPRGREAPPGRADRHRAGRPGREDRLLRRGGRGADAQAGVDERQVRRRHRRRHRQDRRQAQGRPRRARAPVAARPEDLPGRRQVRRLRRDRHQRPPEAGRAGRGAPGLALRRARAAEPLGALARQHAAAARAAGRRAARVHSRRSATPGRRASLRCGRNAASSLPRGLDDRRRGVCAAAGGVLPGARRDRVRAAGGGGRRVPRRRTPRGRRSSAAGTGAARKGAPPLGGTGMDLAEFRARYERPAWTPPPADGQRARVRGFVGLDAGSTSTKAVLLDEDGRVLAKAYQLSRGNPIEDAIEMFRVAAARRSRRGARARRWRASSRPATRRTS